MSTSADKLQSVISDDLFPTVQHISDIKQVLDTMEKKAQNLTEEQIKAIILLQQMGDNEYIHGKKNPYKPLIEYIMKGKEYVADPQYYIDTIEALIPKPPKPVIMAPGMEKGGKK